MNTNNAVAIFAQQVVMRPIWLTIWAISLAFGWLMPTHYWPWTSFQSDVWVALCFATVCGLALLNAKPLVVVHWLVSLIGLYALIPLLQYFSGLVYFAGSAWLGMLFLVGFALSMVTGERWESMQRNQAIDGLFLAIGVAAIGSVGMQLCQWLELDVLGIWLVPGSPSRPFANLAQPNNLATFLIWGCLASAWGYWRKFLSAKIALLMALYLVFGIALTQSRTALLGMLIVAVMLFFWRRNQGGQWLFNSALVLLGFLILCLISIPLVSDALLLVADSRFSNADDAMQDTARSVVYRLFINASFNKMLFGYGWMDTGEAFFQEVLSYPELGVVFFHTHNLFLDLLLWFGWPLGVFLIVAALFWIIVAFRSVGNAESAILFLFVLVVGWHSMVEFPLHYASFLLPCGLVIGAINSRASLSRRFQISRLPVISIFLIAILGLGAIVRDYSLFEDDVRALRFERLNFQVKRPGRASEIIVLTQLKAFLEFSLDKPRTGLTPEEQKWVEEAAFVIFNPLNTFNFIQILALNGRVDDAQIWVGRVKHVIPSSTYMDMSKQWAKAVEQSPELAQVTW